MGVLFVVPSEIDCPGALFLYLYRKIGKLPTEHRSSSITPKPAFVREVSEALALDSGAAAVLRISAIIQTPGYSIVETIGRVLAVMSAIDKVFYAVHPRNLHVPPILGNSFNKVAWLQDLSVKRRVIGVYAEQDGWSLIPRGPLVRASRQEDAASADTVADRFSALGVVPSLLAQEDRPVNVVHRVVSADFTNGVPPSRTVGSEIAVFLPIAEGAADIDIKERDSDGNNFVSFSLPTLDPSAIAIAALKGAGFADIVIVPELMMPHGHLARLADGIASLGTAAPRLSIAGSCDTLDKNELDMPWNESTVINSFGKCLWKQRKIWPAGFSHKRASEFGLQCTPGRLVMEDNASADELFVVDVDTLGRCMVLICQDLQASTLAHEAIQRFQPDWIFTPILDSGITTDRWIHTRLFELSVLSQARYLVASSTSWAVKLGYLDSGCGMALGPRFAGDDEGKQYVIVQATSGFAVASWRTGGWSTSKLQ